VPGGRLQHVPPLCIPAQAGTGRGGVEGEQQAERRGWSRELPAQLELLRAGRGLHRGAQRDDVDRAVGEVHGSGETAVELEVVTALRILRGAGERLEVLGADLLLQHVAQHPWARGGGDRVARPQRAEGEEVPREAQLPHPDPASVERASTGRVDAPEVILPRSAVSVPPKSTADDVP